MPLTAVGVNPQRLGMVLVIKTSQGGAKDRLCRQLAGTPLTRPGVVCRGSASSGSRLMSSSACSQMSGWTAENELVELHLLIDCYRCFLRGNWQQHSRA